MNIGYWPALIIEPDRGEKKRTRLSGLDHLYGPIADIGIALISRAWARGMAVSKKKKGKGGMKNSAHVSFLIYLCLSWCSK